VSLPPPPTPFRVTTAPPVRGVEHTTRVVAGARAVYDRRRMSPRLKRGEPEQVERLQALAAAFRPAAPIDRRALFSGRTEQLGELFSTIDQPGQHAVVFGERGVGKTSLVTVAAETIGAADVLTARTTCDRSDDFETVWRKALDELLLTSSRPGVGFAATPRESRIGGSSLLGEDAAPHGVRRALQRLSGNRRLAVFIDEFDRLEADEVRVLFADTIKALSDALPRVTVVLIGVAEDVDQLIADHQSIERALQLIHMPRMSRDEISEIVTRGLEAARVGIERNALDRAVEAANGLPHYAHLYGQLAGRIALEDLRTRVRLTDVEEALAETAAKRDRARASRASA
jgi:Cdc6-like AAA superfamily ATPase